MIRLKGGGVWVLVADAKLMVAFSFHMRSALSYRIKICFDNFKHYKKLPSFVARNPESTPIQSNPIQPNTHKW